jgi:hypothetical protein
MKYLIHFLIQVVLFSGLVGVKSAWADKMSSSTQDLVIEKMEKALSALDNKDSSFAPSQKRYADLLAERARTRFMQEIEANCDGCKGSKEDRQKAIKIYEQIYSQIDVNEHGSILFQLAHLYEMAGNTDKSIEVFEKLLKDARTKKVSAEILSKSHASLGDLLFQKGKFKEAHAHYSEALKDQNLDGRALVIYNMAWCEFNTDKLTAAIKTLENLLSNPKTITKESEDGTVYDAGFHADIMRDLATFYTRQVITDKNIATYIAIAPEKQKKELIFHFATEADRIGQKNAAHGILSKYLEQAGLTKAERLEAFVRMAQVNFDRGQTAQSNKDFALAAASFKDSQCEDEKKCEELQKTMKRYVTELHRSKKVNPDQSLVNAYIIYSNTFPSDKEMTLRGASLALELKKHKLAIELYTTISNNSKFPGKDRIEALNNEISAAEASGDAGLKKQAYAHYLQIHSEGDKSFEVRYQSAYLGYQAKNFKAAATDFNSLAREDKGPAALRKKSADLALDSLTVLKNDEKIEEWALDYAQIFKSSAKEFQVIARKAVLNQTAAVANNKESNKGDLKDALNKLVKTNLAGASTDEKVVFYTNQSILADKLNEEQIYVQSLQALFSMRELSADKKAQAAEQIVGYYEKHLDFQNAYKAALNLKVGKTSAQDFEFKLATLADLGGLSSAAIHYKKALALGLKGPRSLVIRSRLVLISNNSVRELNAQAPELKRNPTLLNETALFVISKNGTARGLDKVLESKELRNKSAAQWAFRQSFFKKLATFKAQIQNQEINTRSDKAMQRTIQERMTSISKADRLLGDALNTRDITAQMLTLDLISAENERFVRNLAGLPIPKDLSASEQQQYLGILKAKSKPFFLKAKTAQAKLADIWKNSTALSQLINDYRVARPEMRKLLTGDLVALLQVQGSGSLKDTLANTLNGTQMSTRELLTARQSVSENPNDVREIEKLKILETKLGHPLMPTYLDARLNHLQRGKRL